jgi:hypothetical protein
MTAISFPNVPNLPGVPSLPQNGVIQALQVSGAAATLAKTNQWQIADYQYGTPVIVPDSVVEFEFRGEQKIPSYPIENGSFNTYNKVAVPFDARVTVTCGGNGSMSKTGFLAAIKVLLEGLNLVSIVTPDASYGPCNLVHVDYRRESRQGVSLIMAQLWFQEVRQAGATITPAATPDAAAPVTLGQLSPIAPTTAQSATFATPATVASAVQNSTAYAALSSAIPQVVGLLSSIGGSPAVMAQIRNMSMTTGLVNRILGGPISPGVLGMAPSQMASLAQSLASASGASPSAIAAILNVSATANTAASVSKLAGLSIL